MVIGFGKIIKVNKVVKESYEKLFSWCLCVLV